MSFMDNATNPVQLITGLGGAMGQSFLIGNLILLSFFIIFLILSVRYNFNEVLIIDSFVTVILSILFYAAGIVAVSTIIYPLVLFFVVLIFYFFSK